MADQIELATFTTPAGAGNFDVTDAELTETVMAAVVMFTAETTDDSTLSHGIAGCSLVADDGVTTGSIDIGMSGASIDGLNTVPACTSFQFQGPATDVLIATHQKAAANSLAQRHDFVSFIANGLRMNAVTVTDRTKGSALMFAGVARAYVGLAGASTTLQSEAVGGASTFRPDLLILLSSDNGFAGGGSFVNDARFSLGFVIDDGAPSQVSAYIDWDNVTEPSDADGEVSTNRGAISLTTARAIQRVTFTITATGFDHQASAGTPDVPYLAIKFTKKPSMAVGSVATPTSPDAAFSVATPGVFPHAVLGMSTVLAATDTLTDGATAGAAGYFAFTRRNQRAYTVHSEEGVTPAGATVTNADTRQGDHAVLTFDHTGALAHQAELVGLEPGRILLNFATAATGFLTYLAIGEPPGAPRPMRRQRGQRRARAARARRRLFAPGGRPVGQPPLTRGFWRAIQRIRVAMRLRLRRPLPPPSVRFEGVPAEGDGPKGRVFSPGLVRGRVRSTFEEPE